MVKKFKRLDRQAFSVMAVIVVTALLVCTFLAIFLRFTIRDTMVERKMAAINVSEENLFKQLDNVLKLVDELKVFANTDYIETVVNKEYNLFSISQSKFADLTDTWSEFKLEDRIYFGKQFTEGDVVVEISISDLDQLMPDGLGYEYIFLNGSGKVLDDNSVEFEITQSIEKYKEKETFVVDGYVIKTTLIDDLYIAIVDTTFRLKGKIKSIIYTVIAVVMVLILLLSVYIKRITNRVKGDIDLISVRVEAIGNGVFLEKKEKFIYHELEKLDILLCSMGKLIQDRTEEINDININLEAKVKERSHEVLNKNRQLEKEVQDRKKIEEEIKLINSSLDTVIKERTKELETANEALNRNAELAEKANDAKGKFLAVMSHEMRTPLNAIIGFSHMLSMDTSDKDSKETLKLILNASKILLSLINDVLDYAKYESGKMNFQTEQFNFQNDILEVIESFKMLANSKKLDFKTHGVETLDFEVLADQTKIKQVLNNLLNNSMKFTVEGEISIYFDVTKSSDKVMIDCHISDTGIGMTDVTRDQLFEPFVQGDHKMQHKFGGTGLGLSITKEIIEYYQGSISFTSQLDIGTTCRFNLELPLVLEQRQIGKLSYSKILYVDDNIENQKLMQQYFNKYHLPYDVAFDGKEAIRKFKSGEFDLVFMDLQMPIMDGYESTKLIRQLSPNVYIIAMTAYTDQDVKDRCKEIGISDYMKKPIDFGHLNGILGIDNKSVVVTHMTQDHLINDHARRLSEYINFDEDVCKELIYTYIRQLREAFVTIEGLRMSEDYLAISRILHKMKGGAATVRLSKLHNMLTQAEIFSNEHEYQKLFEMIDQMKEVNIIKK